MIVLDVYMHGERGAFLEKSAPLPMHPLTPKKHGKDKRMQNAECRVQNAN